MLDEAADGTEFVQWGESKISLRSYLKRFLFADERITTQVKHLSGGERSRLAAGAHFKVRRQFSHSGRTDQRPGPADVARAGRGVDRVSGSGVRGQPRPLFSQPRLHGHPGVRGRRPDPSQRGRLRLLPGEKSEGARKPPRAWMRNGAEKPPCTGRVKPARQAGQSPANFPSRKRANWKGWSRKFWPPEEEIARIEGLFASPDFHRTHATQNQRTAGGTGRRQGKAAAALRALGGVGGAQDSRNKGRGT